MMDIRCGIEEITPDRARQLLDINHRNRQLSQPAVNRLVEIIHRNEWMEDSTDAIGIDRDGGVVNGQHRLQAVIAANAPIRALIVYGVRPEVIKVIDQGRGRTLAQYLAMSGDYDEPSVLAGALEWIYRMQSGYERTMSQEVRPTVPQLLDVLTHHPKLVYSVAPAAEAKGVGVDPKVGTAYHYAFADVNSERADEFFERLGSGEGLENNNPIHTLRERLIEDIRRKATPNGTGVHVWEKVAWLVKAWEAYRAGEELSPRQLKFVKSGPRAERVPHPTDVSWLRHLDIEDLAA